jgi:predicted dinucleotide-binding enzyme
MKNMKVGILGSGEVGQSFAHAFGALGHEVTIGSRSPEKLSEFARGEGDRVSAGTFEQAARSGDVIVLATHGVATEEAIKLAGKQNFDHKVVIDATNPLDMSGGAPKLSVGHTDSFSSRSSRADRRICFLPVTTPTRRRSYLRYATPSDGARSTSAESKPRATWSQCA